MKIKLKKIIGLILIKIFGNIYLKSISGINHYENAVLGILEKENGYFKSVEKKQACDVLQNPVPWFTYPAIEFLKQLNLSKKVVFEWGSGNSSLFFASRVKSIHSIEHNKIWFEKVNSNKQQNQQIEFVEDTIESYVHSINKAGKLYDIIIIDGDLFRKECAIEAIKFLNVGGIIILDNADWFKGAAKILSDAGLIQADYHGFGPINDYTWVTSIFYHKEYNFEYFNNIRPAYANGGMIYLYE